MSDPPPEEGDNCLLSQSALWQAALVDTANCIFFFFFFASAAAVCVLCWKKIINRVNSDRAGSPPRRPATLRLLPCVSTSLPQSVASLELKFFYFPVVCLCRELSGVPSAEGSGPWFSLAKCSASLPSKPDLETCLLSTHGESSLKFHGTWTSAYSRDLFTYCNITLKSLCITFTEQ